MPNRREFVMKFVPLAGAAAMLPRVAFAADLPDLEETEAFAKTMQFHKDWTKADQKAPHKKGEHCADCSHYTTPGAEKAKCDLFNKAVPKNGWCTGFSKRP